MTLVDVEGSLVDLLYEAADQDTSPWRLAALADDPHPDVRMAVATNPSAPSLTLLRLRGDVNPRIQVVLAARFGASR